MVKLSQDMVCCRILFIKKFIRSGSSKANVERDQCPRARMPMLVYPCCNHFFAEIHTAAELGILDFTRSGGCVLRYTLHFHDQSRGKMVIIYNRLCMKNPSVP